MATKKIIKLTLIIGVLGIFGYIFSFCYKMITAVSKDPVVINNSIPDEYLKLFSNDIRKKLVSKSTFIYKLRNSISLFTYDSKYALEVTKINSSTGLPVNQIINESKDYVTRTDGIIYKTCTEQGFKSSYQLGDTLNPTKIKLNLYGDDISIVIKNDSVAYYYLKLKKISVSYNPYDVESIFVDAYQGLEKYSDIPLNVMFLKKNKALYFIMLVPINPNSKIETKLLYNIIIN